jgi:hypothetical protein
MLKRGAIFNQRTVLMAAAALLAAGSGFLLARANGGSTQATGAHPQSSISATAPTPEPAGQASEPNAIDTSKPGWAIPYLDADQALPRFEGTIAGVRLAAEPPDDYADRWCDPGDPDRAARWIPSERVEGSKLALPDVPLPPRSSLFPEGTKGVQCGGTVVLATYWYFVGSSDGVTQDILSGRVSWFDADHGGAIVITRRLASQPPFARWSQPAERTIELVVNGHAVAAAPPILGGLGSSAVAFAADGVVTTISGTDMRLDVLIRIAEVLVK